MALTPGSSWTSSGLILSALDLSPVTGDATQAEAVRQTIEVARAAERFGYHRLWLAEHHNIPGLGSPAPEADNRGTSNGRANFSSRYVRRASTSIAESLVKS